MTGEMNTFQKIDILSDALKYLVNNEIDCPISTPRYMDNIKKALNSIYPNFKCTSVLYTKNTDHEFFGCRLYPCNREMNNTNIANYFIGDYNDIEPAGFKPFTSYQLELDSKLFTSIAQLESREIATLLIHDIDAYVGTRPLAMFSSNFEDCLMNMETTLCRKSVQRCPELFIFVINECMRYMLSAFTMLPYNPVINLNEVVWDDRYALLKDALYKINCTFPETNAEGIIDYKNYSIRNARILMEWYLNIYTSLDVDRYPLILLKKSIKYSGSELFKNKVNSIINCLEKCYWNNVDMGEAVSEGTKPGFFAKLKMDGLKSIEEDLYEYKMRIRNVETQDDAILLMRQINNRMAILDEFLLEHPELTEKDRKHWYDVFDKYQTLREELSDKAVYNKKMYGLFVDYNMLQQMSDSNQLLNTYY